MATQHTAFVLRILDGFNAGAAVRLKTGSVLVGSSMTSDIVLHDENIADQHIQLLVTPTTVALQPLVRPVLVGGEEVRAESVDLQPYQAVTLGKVTFQIIDSRIPAPAHKPEVIARTQNGKGTGRAGKAQSERAGVEAAPAHLPKQAAASARVATGLGGGFWLAMGLGGLLLANVLYWSPHWNRLLQNWGLGTSPTQEAAQVLQRLGQDFALDAAPDGTVVLTGYTADAAGRDAIMGQLQQAGVQANVRVWVREDMVNAANMIAQALGETGVKLHAGKADGELVAVGLVGSAAAWERIRAGILADVAGVKSLDTTQLRLLDEYVDDFVQFIQKKGLSDRVKAETDGKRVIVKGELTRAEIDALQQASKEFVAQQGGNLDIELQVADVRDRIVLAIRSVSVGKVPFLVDKEGKKYMEGSSLGGKYFIKSIKADHVVLTNNGIDIPFYYGIDKGNNKNAAN